MYRALARSHVTLNRHINVAENYANNMRLYEATGVGTLLITDHKDNLGELFDVGKEVVAYSSPEEAADLMRYYLDHPEEASEIARAGQARTLREHTYQRRMEELVGILQRFV
jgi:spore maturation protein CgeB